jgi:uncharacterized protein with PhoU and TrkA domain
MINPSSTEQIREGDVLIARGVSSGVRRFVELAEGSAAKKEV